MSDGLRPALGPWQFFSFAFGSIVGVGWVVLLGDWLQRGGPVGAMLGFAVGGALMVLIGFCYGEAATMFPVSGGEVAYAQGTFGSGIAYAIGWGLCLAFVGAVSYTASSLAWIVDYLIPGIRGPALYEFRGAPIHSGSLIVALLTVATFTGINWRGVKSSGRFQDVFTYGKLLIALSFILAGVFGGSLQHLEPPFAVGGRSAIGGVLAVMAVVPWFLGGFNTLGQVMEEKSPGTPLSLIGRIIAISIVAGAAFYCLVILSAAMSTPWQRLLTMELPTAAAFREAFGSELLTRVVLVTGLFGIATVGNGTFVAVTRILFALSRASLLGTGFRHTHPRTGAPDRAVLFTGAAGALGTLMGRQGIGPIVTVGAVGLALAYLVSCAAVWRLRVTQPDRERPYRVPLGSVVAPVATLGSAALVFAAIRDPWAAAGGGFPLEWKLLAGWAVLGLLLWLMHRSAARTQV